ncbi:MAG: SDR family oxidoreductase, partial [Sphingopyxis sp.]
LHSRSGGQADAPLQDALRQHGTQWHQFSGDLGDDGAAAALFQSATRAFARAPMLIINNASHFGDDDLSTMDEAAQRAHLAVNLVAPVQLARCLASAANAANAASAGDDDRCVINILDQRVANPVADQLAYTLSKQALWQSTRTMAVAMAPHVRVNAVAPGLTLPTPDYADGQMDRMAAAMPLRRLPTPADIADGVAYLAQARSVTGQTLFVDGGANLKSFDRDFIAM